jgi:phosphatidylglycerol---prolipoprotein diacylglyceryl transferase
MFHWYGFLVGLGVVVCILSVEFALKKWLRGKNEAAVVQYFWQLLVVNLLFAVVGARLWHGITDFHLYQSNIVDLLWITQGGLSILGAVLGGTFGIFFFQWFKNTSAKFNSFFWLDLIILGVPIGQMIGRLGNWVNQELYGLPTNLPWAIYIDAPNRVAGYEQFATFHPLFLYEIVLLAPLSFVLWTIFFKSPYKIGTGFFVALYGVWYGLGRFLLEFIRIDKAIFSFAAVGVNQLILLGIALVCFAYLLFLATSSKNNKKVIAE